MRHESEDQKKTSHARGDAMTGWEVLLLGILLFAAFREVLPPFLYLPVWIATLVLLQYLWHIGFFKFGKYHSRHDAEVGKKIDASQLRLKEEEERTRKLREEQQYRQPDDPPGQYP